MVKNRDILLLDLTIIVLLGTGWGLLIGTLLAVI
jgi:hypothetical protein